MSKPKFSQLEIGVIFRSVAGFEGVAIAPLAGIAVDLLGQTKRLDADTPISHFGESQNRIIQWRAF